MDPNQMTRAEYDRVIASIEAQLPRPMRRPDGVVRIVGAHNFAERLAAGWTYATEGRS